MEIPTLMRLEEAKARDAIETMGDTSDQRSAKDDGQGEKQALATARHFK
jgi:hypothetical protein